MTAPAPDVILRGGRYGEAIRFGRGSAGFTAAAVVPVPEPGQTGTCLICRTEFPLSELEPTQPPNKGYLVCREFGACAKRRTKADKLAAAGSVS